MKINIITDSKNSINGYENIVAGIKLCILDDFVDDAEADEIFAEHIIEKYTIENCGKSVENWIKKLAHGGILTIKFVESKSLARAFSRGTINIDDYNKLAYNGAKSAHTIYDLCDYLKDKGLLVTKKKLEGFIGVIEAQRQ